MSEKEQAEAVKLLAEVARRLKEKTLDAADVALIDRVDRFLALPLVGPESHGLRRS